MDSDIWKGTYWDYAYRRYGDAAGEAFAKAWQEYLSGEGENPMCWGLGKVLAACEQAQRDNRERERAQKRGGNVSTCSLSDPVSDAEDLTIEDVVSGRHGLSDSTFNDEPEESVLAKESVRELCKDPLELCRRGWIRQKMAAKWLGVSQSTISRLLA